MKSYLSAIILIMFLGACKSPELLLHDQKLDRIYFGRSGGFTNIPIEYVYFENGRLYKLDQERLKKIGNPGRKSYAALVNRMKLTEFDQINLNEPGNVTYHIRVVRSGIEKVVRWSDSSDNQAIKDLYNALLLTLKKTG